jgi:hypothetical protein
VFWRRKNKKKEKVKKIEGDLWTYMSKYVALDELRYLRMVERDAILGDKSVGLTMVRIFNPAAASAQDVTVDNYKSLDSHPELVLYEGYYRQDNGRATDIHIDKKLVRRV